MFWDFTLYQHVYKQCGKPCCLVVATGDVAFVPLVVAVGWVALLAPTVVAEFWFAVVADTLFVVEAFVEELPLNAELTELLFLVKINLKSFFFFSISIKVVHRDLYFDQTFVHR